MYMVWVRDKRQLWSVSHPVRVKAWLLLLSLGSFTVYTPLCHMYMFHLSGLVSKFSTSLYIYSPFKISCSVSNCSLLPAVSTFHSISSFFAFSLETDVTDWNSWQIKRRTFQYLGWIQTVYQWQQAAAEQKWEEIYDCRQSSLRAKTSQLQCFSSYFEVIPCISPVMIVKPQTQGSKSWVQTEKHCYFFF